MIGRPIDVSRYGVRRIGAGCDAPDTRKRRRRDIRRLCTRGRERRFTTAASDAKHSLNPVQPVDIRIPLVLERRPVKLVGDLCVPLVLAKPVRSGFTDGIGDVGGVPHEFWGVSGGRVTAQDSVSATQH